MCALHDTQRGAGGEVQFADAVREVIVHDGRVLAVPLAAGRRRHDVGSLESYCAAFLEDTPRGPRFGGSLRARAAQLLDG
jgi:UTP-glucose-1-phosphate uridylyltransferase